MTGDSLSRFGALVTFSISSMLRACRQPTFRRSSLNGGKSARPPDVGVGFFRCRPTRVSNFAQLPFGPARNNESAGDACSIPPLSQLGGVRFSKGSGPPKHQKELHCVGSNSEGRARDERQFRRYSSFPCRKSHTAGQGKPMKRPSPALLHFS